MDNFVTFRHKSNGIVASYPAHYATHPTIGPDLELYVPGDDEYEEDKVVVAGNELPVEQRAVVVSTPYKEKTNDELKQLLRARDLPVSGNHDELVARLTENNEDN